ncbi:MAG: hypothetical protein QM541_11430 [Flavobacterium sp.]|nr:hypothetical protein [Flavobacterium sp.]
MREITIQVNCPHCNGVKVKKNSKKATGKQNFLCHDCKKQFQYAYFYKDAELAKKELVKSMTLNGSGIRNISRVLGLSLGCILGVLRIWFKETNEPSFSGTYKEVQIDEMWTFVENRKQRNLGFGMLMIRKRRKY